MKNNNNESRANRNNYDEQKFVIELTFPKDAGDEEDTLNEILQKICHNNFEGSGPYSDIRTVVYDNSNEVNNNNAAGYESGLCIYFDEMDRRERYDTACRLFSVLKEMFSNEEFVEMLSDEKRHLKCPVVISPEIDARSAISEILEKTPIWCPILSDEEEKGVIKTETYPSSLVRPGLSIHSISQNYNGECVACVDVKSEPGRRYVGDIIHKLLSCGIFMEIRIRKSSNPIYGDYFIYCVINVNTSLGKNNDGSDIRHAVEYQNYMKLLRELEKCE